MDLQVTFRSPEQEAFYYATQRNQCYSGGFTNGKSYGGCLKAVTLATTFANSRGIIARQVAADLKRTTMETFFKICPREIIESHNNQDGLTILKNRSRINWLHLDKVEESTLRGIEPNWVLVDQAEETEEKTYDVLDSRVGRWDDAEVPQELISAVGGNWPQKNGKYIAPSYMMLLCNPDTQFHYIYRKYHPNSLERNLNYFFVEAAWNPLLGSEETYSEALKRDEEWVDKYVRGQWGISHAQIHRVLPESFLDFSEELIERILRKGNLYRILDHGDASPTCCLWAAAIDNVFIFFREYYMPNATISTHRANIRDLSGSEQYSGNYADPQIFKTTAQKDGGFWSVADEYMTSDIEAPPLHFIPADNNEFATRNRINELLKRSDSTRHPITGEPGPGIYFVKRSEAWPQGIYHGISELQSQRRKLLGYVDGKAIYCDDREKSVADHSYDCVRYFIAMHGRARTAEKRQAPRMSLKFYEHLRKRAANLVKPMSAA